MGPIAGIGDSLVVGTVIPILLGIALGMSFGGSLLVLSSISSYGTYSHTLE